MGTTPAKGRADYLELGDWNAACAECGRKRKASEMRQLPPGVPGGGMWVCFPEHWTPRQPQDYVRGIPEKMNAPWVQQQVDYAPLEVQNVDSDTTELEIEIDTAAAEAGSEPLIINVFEGVTVGNLTITDVSGGVAAASIVLNNYGVIEELANPDDVDITIQGGGLTIQDTAYTLVADVSYDPPFPTEYFGYNGESGSITPTTLNGHTIQILISGIARSGLPQTLLQINGDNLAQDFFTTITINGFTLASSAADYTPAVGSNTWDWLGTQILFATGTYEVSFT